MKNDIGCGGPPRPGCWANTMYEPAASAIASAAMCGTSFLMSGSPLAAHLITSLRLLYDANDGRRHEIAKQDLERSASVCGNGRASPRFETCKVVRKRGFEPRLPCGN